MIKSQSKYTFALQTFVCICLLALTTFAAAAPEISFKGRVIRSTGDQPPIEGAEVRLEAWPELQFPILTGLAPLATARTGKDGSFVLSAKPVSERLRISAVAPGFALYHYYTDNTRTDEDHVLILRPGVAVSGVVQDAAGKPVRGAVVQATDPYGETTSQGVEAVSGSDGAFALAGLEARFRLIAIAPGYLISATDRVSDATAQVRIVMQPAVTKVEIETVDRLGKPVKGAIVRVRSEDGTGGESGLRAVVGITDAKGFFRTDVLPEGRIETRVRRALEAEEAWGRNYNREQTMVGETYTERIVLPTETIIKGIAVDADTERPLAGAVVLARNSLHHGPEGRLPLRKQPDLKPGELEVSGDDGRFEVRQETAHNEFTVNFEPPPGYVYLPNKNESASDVRVIVPEGTTIANPITLRFRKGVYLSGVVISPLGKPEGAGVQVGANAAPMQGTKTDAMGKFRVLAMPDKAVRVFATSEFGYGESAPLEVPTSGTAPNIEIRTNLFGSISGRVLIDGKPVERVPVAAESPSTNHTAFGFTDAEGFYGMKIRAGTLQVQARPHSMQTNLYPAPLTVTVAHGQDVENIDFAIGGGESVDGIVTDAAGKALRDVRITRISDPPTFDPHGQIRTNSAGAFTIPGMKKGEVIPRLAVELAGYIRKELSDVAVTGKVLKIVLEKTPTAMLTVRDAAGKPVTSYRLLIEEKHPGTGNPPRFFPSYGIEAPKRIKNAEGRVALDKLDINDYRVTIESDEESSTTLHGSIPFSIKLGEADPVLNITAIPGRALQGKVIWEGTDEPIPDALIVLGEPGVRTSADPNNPSPHDLSYKITKSDQSGLFTIPSAPPSIFSLSAQQGENRSLRPLDLDLSPDRETTEPVLSIPKPAVVHGRVIGRDGKPITGAKVSVLGMYEQAQPLLTDQEGGYTLTRPVDGFFGVQFILEDSANPVVRFANAFRRDKMTPIIPARADLDLSGAVELTIELIGNGKPFSKETGLGFQNFFSLSEGGLSVSHSTIQTGNPSSFTLMLPPGKWRLMCMANMGSPTLLLQDLELAPTPSKQTRKLEFAFGTAQMRIIPSSATPIGGTLRFRPVGSEEKDAKWWQMQGTETTIPALPAGRYLATFTSYDQKWTGTSPEFTITNGETTKVEITIEPAKEK